MINVTKPFLPEVDLYQKYIKQIFERGWLTNNGPLVQELENKLKHYLGVPNLFFVNNGTIALQIAIKALKFTGEVITTPFSYVATTNSIIWEGCTPVFADINESDFNINPAKIEALITEKTTGILATHVYGNPCDVEMLDTICRKHNLKIIYDGAHAFGTMYKNKALLSFGDVATCSFHATKLFHTVEGGAVITNNAELAETIMLYRQFGHIGDEYYSIGVNGKASEMHAAMGLCILPEIDRIIEKRKKLSETYDNLLKGINVFGPVALENTIRNYAYYPIVFENEALLIKARQHLADCSVNTRRYFYPSLNKLPFLEAGECPVSESISKRVLALPMYEDLNTLEIETIVGYLKKIVK